MMKNFTQKLLGLSMCLFTVAGASAYEFNEGGIYYNFSGNKKNLVVTYKEKDGNKIVNDYTGDIEIPQIVKHGDVEYGVVGVGGDAFHNSTITSIVIPEGVTQLYNSAFADCNQLALVTIPSTVTQIGRWEFLSSALTDVKVPEGVVTIDNYAFQKCTKLTTIDLPSTVTTYGIGVFAGATSLESITNRAVTPLTVNENMFTGVNVDECTLYVPETSVDAYKADAVWGKFKVEKIGASTSVETVDGEKITVIGADGYIAIEGADNNTAAMVYDVNGSVVYSGNAEKVSVAAGVYVVKVGNKVSKVLVK